MIITINDKYFIDREPSCYTLKSHTGNYDKKGNEVTTTYGYYSDLKFLIKTVVRLMAEDELGDATTLEEYLLALKRQNDEIANLLKGIEK